MTRVHSIKGRLSVVFLFLFVLVIVLGLESLRSLNFVNEASAQIRVRWLPGTRALGDLNNLTTDYPAAEEEMRRAATPSELATSLHKIANLDHGIAAAAQAYAQMPHDGAEQQLFTGFQRQWEDYRRSVAARASGSGSAYDAASALLGRLTARNIAGAREASELSDRVYHQSRQRIIAMLVLAGLLVAGATLHVTRSVSAPLLHLASRMHRLARNETDIDVPGTIRQDEIGDMARAVVVFRNNAIALSDNRQAMAQQAKMLQERLAEEQRLTLLQRNFVAMASHEFRTPLALIDGHAQRLVSLRDRLTATEIAERAGKMRSAVRRMTQLIDNLIGSGRLIDGRMDLHFEPRWIDLNAILREAGQLQRELTPDADIRLGLESAALPVMGDPALLSQVFGNLLSNAVKYSPAGGEIQLRATRIGGMLRVEIEDRGIGICERDRDRLFEPYFRGSNTTGIVGSGVGLYLVRTIVDLHHGAIEVDSRETCGSRFTINLPCAPEVTAAAFVATPASRAVHGLDLA